MRALFVLLLVFPLAACSAFWPEDGAADDPVDAQLRFDGTVTYAVIEGGAWVIESDAGDTYEPVDLASEYEEEGLRVRVWADVREDLGSFLMVGPIIQIERIERL